MLEELRAAVRGLALLRRGLAEKFADELAEGFVGRAVTLMVDVMLQIVEQFIGGGVAFVKVAREGAVEDFVEAVVDAACPIPGNRGWDGS